MDAADDLVTIEMPSSYDPDGECQPEVRVTRLGNPVLGGTGTIEADPDGDYEIVTREPILGRPDWWRYTLRKVR